jgi:hypothetical protein
LFDNEELARTALRWTKDERLGGVVREAQSAREKYEILVVHTIKRCMPAQIVNRCPD